MKISQVIDNVVGDNFTYIAPVNMYGVKVGDDVFVGPFCDPAGLAGLLFQRSNELIVHPVVREK